MDTDLPLLREEGRIFNGDCTATAKRLQIRGMQSSLGESLRTMVARVSPDDVVIYANGALSAYLGASKSELVGAPMAGLAARCRGEISSCFARPDTGRSSNHLVTDEDGRVFEAKLYSDGGVLDIVLDEVTTAESIGRELRTSSGTPFETLSEDELRTTRHPERRYLTVSFTQLRGLGPVTDRLPPMEVRLMVNSFVEEVCDAVFATGCTVGETSGDSVLGIYGAPRYFADHPLRAIRAVCDQMHRSAQLHSGFYRQGKELPPCACGLWTGDTLVGTLGNSSWQHYTAIGTPVDLAIRLSQLGRPGEVLLPEHTLTHLLRQLPKGWQHVRAESEYEPDLSDFQWTSDEIAPVPEHLKKIVYLVGPGVQENADRVEFYFDYLWSFRVPGRDQVVPILRVVRPAQAGDSLELNDDNVVSTQVAQTLGKYKLIDVVGTGGMGKVWRGVDRFGNAVAIKVLHSGETVTEAQLKRFRREAEIMARLPHRNICRVYEMNEFDGIQYIAMEFVDGLTLSDLLYDAEEEEKATGKYADNVDLRALIHSIRVQKSRELPLPEGEEPPPRPAHTRVLPIEQTLSVVLKICDALQFAHEHGVLHRDLKPGNILLRVDGEPLVADFGLAKLNTADATHSLSMTGHVVGTLENMAPEQAQSSKTVDERADVYSIGTILYQMLTGRKHFDATGNIVADAQTLKTHEPVKPRAINPKIDADLEIITLKALRNDPVERYRSVAALKADLEHYKRGEVISAKPVSPAELFKKLVLRNKSVTIVTATSLLIFICGTIVAIYSLNRQVEEAERQTAIADERAQMLEKQSVVEKGLRERAELKEREAKEFSSQLQAATEATKAAEQLGNKAVEEREVALSEAQRLNKEREDAEKKAKDLQKRIAELQTTQDARASQEAVQPLVESTPATTASTSFLTARPERSEEANDALNEARQIFNMELAPTELGRFDKNPEEVVRRLNRAMDYVSRALMIQPDLLSAWMLKGRLHLALMEYERAAEAFTKAGEVSERLHLIRNDDDPAAMLQIAAGLSRTMGEKYAKGGQMLRSTSSEQNQVAGYILLFLADKPGLRRSSVNSLSPLGRKLTPGEVALALVAKNGAGTRVFIKPARSGGHEVIIWDADNVSDLTPLREMECTALSVVGAKTVDWNTILSLNLEALNLSKCGVESLPSTLRDFQRIRTLNLAGTEISNIEFVRGMPLLETLDISSTHVTDLSPLQGRGSLRSLDLQGLNPSNLRVLGPLGITSLVLSPMLVTDKVSLSSLRLHRTLKILRALDDPPEQPAYEFWRKLDSGLYQESQ